jgi:hypothetical protein
MSIRFNTVRGLAYGVALAAVSWFATGSGHGTYLPLYVSSAPFGAFGITAALAGTLVLWTAVGAGFEWFETPRARLGLRLLLLGHYCSGAALLVLKHDEWRYLRKPAVLLSLVVWGLVYIAGQRVAWRDLRGRWS